MKDVGGIRDGTLTVRDNRCGTGVKAEALNVTGVDRRIDSGLGSKKGEGR